MAQGLIVGCTDYSMQTKNDIAKDIERWIDYSTEIKQEYKTLIEEMSNNGYWNKTVPLEFRLFCRSTDQVIDTIISDLFIVKQAIDENRLTMREMQLLDNIGKCVHEMEQSCYKSFKNTGMEWQEYGEVNFSMAEKLYSDGRDYFATLFDVENARKRLEDYIDKDSSNILIQMDNSVSIGNGNKIKKSAIGNRTMNEESKNKKENWFVKNLREIIVGVIIAIIGGLILRGL